MMTPEQKRQLALAALERRKTNTRPRIEDKSNLTTSPRFNDFDLGYDRRTVLRRKIDIDILGKKGTHLASKEGVEGLKVLLKLGNNILKSPGDARFRAFKVNSELSRKYIYGTKGVLDFAIEMGFRRERVTPKTSDPVREFVGRDMEHLKLCIHLIEEAIYLEQHRVDDKLVERRRLEESEDHKQQALSCFKDDRKSVKQRCDRERSGHHSGGESGQKEHQVLHVRGKSFADMDDSS